MGVTTTGALRLAASVGAAALTLILAGCSLRPATVAAPEPSTATPTCAVPAQPGVEPPAGCVVYDPEAGMRSNDLYRQRMEISPEAQAAGAALVEPASAALERLRVSGTALTESSVRSALAEAGLSPDGIQIREDGGWVLFGATYSAPSDSIASCVYGSASTDAVTVEIGGLIMDGGCLPAQ